jgi:hypothetical protein
MCKVHLVSFLAGKESLDHLVKELERGGLESILVQGDFLLPSVQQIIVPCLVAS